MKKIGFISALVVAMTAVSCVEDINTVQSQNGSKTFEATFDATASKAVLKPGVDESKVEWNKGDQVSVLVGEGKYMYEAQSDGLTTTLATAAADVPSEGTFYGLYPYDENAVLASGVVTTSLPASQTAVLGSFSTHLAVAQSTSGAMAFKNVCGLVKVNVSSDNVTSIVFEGNSGEVVAGAINVTVADAPAWAVVEGQGATSVTLLPAEGQTTIAAGDYYFAVLPQTFAAGFKVTSNKNDGYSVVRNVETEVVVERSGMVAGKSFGISGKGTEAEPYVIMTPQDMVDMRSLAKHGGETWFKLGADIDMKGVTNYVPVNYNESFERKIHFDGDNHTIDNFYSNFSSYPSLFGVLYGSCKNLKVTNAVIEGTSVSGIIGGYIGTTDKPATVTNVSVQGQVSSSTERVGGFAGNVVGAVFTDCSADVTVVSTFTSEKGGGDVGGFAGKVQGESSFINCSSKASVSVVSPLKNRASAFVGWANGTTVTFKNCKVLTGSVVTDNSGKASSAIGIFGGLVAYAGSSVKTVIEGCSVDVTIESPWAQSVGGFVGIVGTGGAIEVKSSDAKGVVKGSNQVSGGIAYVESASQVTITDTHTSVSVTGQTAAGAHYCAGLIGNIASAESTVLKNCYTTGDVTSGGSSNSGLVGAVTVGTILLEDCYATGSLVGNNNCGGLIGNCGVDGTIKNSYYKGPKITAGGTSAGLVGNSKVTSVINSYAETDITGSSGAGIAGLIGSQSVALTMTGCHYSGNISTARENSAGLIGRSTEAAATIKSCYSTGTIICTANKNNIGGLLGYATAFTLSDSWSSMNVEGIGQGLGGIVGTCGAPSTISNCYYTGNVKGRACTGGVIGQSYNNADGNVVQGCVVWGNVTNTKTVATQYSGGAIIGCVHTKTVTAKNCWRNPNMVFTDYSGVYEGEIIYDNSLVDHEDITNALPPYVAGISDTATNAYAQRPYHGKAAAADATVTSVAKSIGWDETIWDLSGSLPVLK